MADGEGFRRELRQRAKGVVEDLQGLGASIGDSGDDLEVFDIGNSVRAYVGISSVLSKIISKIVFYRRLSGKALELLRRRQPRQLLVGQSRWSEEHQRTLYRLIEYTPEDRG